MLWTLRTFAWILAVTVIVHMSRAVAEWLRLWWYLLDVPKPRPQKSFVILLDVYKQLSAMGPTVDIKVKAFRYLKGLFKSFEDQDVTVAFYGPYAILLGATPQVTEAIFSSTTNVTKAFFYKMLKPWIGEGIITLNNEAWKTRRKTLMPSLHFRVLDVYNPIMDKRGERLMRKLANRNGEYFDVLPLLRAAAFGVLLETTMGVDCNEDDVETLKYLKIHDAICEGVIRRIVNIHHWFDCVYAFSKDRGVMSKYVEEAKDFANRILQKRIADYRNGIRDAVSEKSLLEVLVRKCVDEGALSETDVRDEIISTMIGGFDFTATGAAFALYLLGHHPDIQSKVQDEIDAAFGDDFEKPLDAEAIKGLTYMECVLKEAMRLYPPGPLLARSVARDMKIGKYTIPRGTVAVVAFYFLQRHPRYIEDPECFMPERFMGTKSIPAFAYAPFAAGPRNCIGQKFALTEQKIFLTHILRRFNIKSKVPMDKLELALDMVLKPVQGIELMLTPRTLPSSEQPK